MTPKRKAALQWFHDRGAARSSEFYDQFSVRMLNRLRADGQICWGNNGKELLFTLTDKGRRDLHEAGR